MKDLNITLIQSDLHWENIHANLQMFSKKISSVKKETDLIVLPEMFSTGFTMNNKAMAETMEGRTINWMKKTAKEKKCVVTGSIIIEEKSRLRVDPSSIGKKYYNRLIWMQPNGKYKTYDKRHLFRYASEQNYYTAGKKKLIVDLKGWKICPMICYDLRFPVWIRNKIKIDPSTSLRMTADYDLLLFIANWPERRSHPWKTLLMARAMENQCYVAGVNRIGNDGNNIYHSGDSSIVNFKGEIISKTKPHKESIETIMLSKKDLEKWRKTFPAWMDADKFRLMP